MNAIRQIRLVVAILLVLGAAEAVANDSIGSTVKIKDFMFSPVSLTVSAGANVSWVNLDAEVHTVVGEGFRSGALDTTDSFSFKFDKPGTYHFVCSIHPQMLGTIVVK